jgi:hypothetical protein
VLSGDFNLDFRTLDFASFSLCNNEEYMLAAVNKILWWLFFDGSINLECSDVNNVVSSVKDHHKRIAHWINVSDAEISTRQIFLEQKKTCIF